MSKTSELKLLAKIKRWANRNKLGCVKKYGGYLPRDYLIAYLDKLKKEVKGRWN